MSDPHIIGDEKVDVSGPNPLAAYRKHQSRTGMSKVVTDLQPGDIVLTGRMWRVVTGVFVHTPKTMVVNFTTGPGRIYNNDAEVEMRPPA